MKKNLLILLLLTLVISCSKTDDSSDGDFDGSIRSITDFYNEDLIKALEDLGFQINTGNTPPNLQGSYFISPYKLSASTVNGDYVGKLFTNYIAHFTNQDNESLTIDFKGEQGDNEDNGYGSFISGEGNKFSIFLKVTTKQEGVDYVVESASSISGVINDEGDIENFQKALIMLNDNGDPDNLYIENNTGRLLYDSDFISEKQ